MDVEQAYTAFLDALDKLNGIAVIGPSYFSTSQSWPLPAIVIDIDSLAIGNQSEDANDIALLGLTLPMVIHIPITNDLRGLLKSMLVQFSGVLGVILATFVGYKITVSDVWNTVVPFGGGEAYGMGFTLTATVAQ